MEVNTSTSIFDKKQAPFIFIIPTDEETENTEVYDREQTPVIDTSAFQLNLDNIYKRKIEDNYNDFLKSRIEYLESLKNLGDNWITGDSKQPSLKSIEKAKNLLDLVIKNLIEKNFSLPRILMSPIPTGGISFDLRFDVDNSILFTIHDDENIEMECERDGEYNEVVEVDTSIISGLFSDYLREYELDTRWRSFV